MKMTVWEFFILSWQFVENTVPLHPIRQTTQL